MKSLTRMWKTWLRCTFYCTKWGEMCPENQVICQNNWSANEASDSSKNKELTNRRLLHHDTVWSRYISRRRPVEIREFKKLRRQLQGKRHIKIELGVKLSLLQLFHVNHVVQDRRSAFSLAWHEWFSCQGKEWKIYSCELGLSSELQIWKFHVIVWQTTSKNCTKKLPHVQHD